jgi:hypothetical protein
MSELPTSEGAVPAADVPAPGPPRPAGPIRRLAGWAIGLTAALLATGVLTAPGEGTIADLERASALGVIALIALPIALTASWVQAARLRLARRRLVACGQVVLAAGVILGVTELLAPRAGDADTAVRSLLWWCAWGGFWLGVAAAAERLRLPLLALPVGTGIAAALLTTSILWLNPWLGRQVGTPHGDTAMHAVVVSSPWVAVVGGVYDRQLFRLGNMYGGTAGSDPWSIIGDFDAATLVTATSLPTLALGWALAGIGLVALAWVGRGAAGAIRRRIRGARTAALTAILLLVPVLPACGSSPPLPDDVTALGFAGFAAPPADALALRAADINARRALAVGVHGWRYTWLGRRFAFTPGVWFDEPIADTTVVRRDALVFADSPPGDSALLSRIRMPLERLRADRRAELRDGLRIDWVIEFDPRQRFDVLLGIGPTAGESPAGRPNALTIRQLRAAPLYGVQQALRDLYGPNPRGATGRVFLLRVAPRGLSEALAAWPADPTRLSGRGREFRYRDGVQLQPRRTDGRIGLELGIIVLPDTAVEPQLPAADDPAAAG